MAHPCGGRADITWLLDGLEGNLAGSLAGVLKRRETLGLTDAQIGLGSTIYWLGAVLGALFFGYATDRWDANASSASPCFCISARLPHGLLMEFHQLHVLRALTGAGIGGEYAAINSAVDELIPARVRGHADLLINSTSGSELRWVRGLPGVFPIDLGWRFAFGIGAADLAKGTGRFNFLQGSIQSAMGLGAFLSNLAFGFVAKAMGFNAAFIGLSSFAVLGGLLYQLRMPETRASEQ